MIKERIKPSQARRSEAIARAKARLAGTEVGARAANPEQQKKAAWLPRRPFLSHGGATLAGDFGTSAGAVPGGVLIGCRCISGQSRTVARTVAMVSHLRKMTQSTAPSRTAQPRAAGCPRCLPCLQRVRATDHRPHAGAAAAPGRQALAGLRQLARLMPCVIRRTPAHNCLSAQQLALKFSRPASTAGNRRLPRRIVASVSRRRFAAGVRVMFGTCGFSIRAACSHPRWAASTV